MSIDLKHLESLGIRPPATTSGAGKASASPQQPKGETGVASPESAAQSDSVSLTSAGMQLAQVDQNLSRQPVVDSQRVAQIRQKILSGTYAIDPQRIADKLLSYEFAVKK